MAPRQKVALVTGCSRGGIGYALCVELAAQGAIVYATARQLGLMDGLEQLGCTLLQLDVTDAAAVRRVVDTVLQQQGRISVLINNAGAVIKGWAVETPLEDVRRLMEVNFFAVLSVTNAVAPHMVKARSGTILNISSSCAYVPVATASAYCASKAALRMYSDALRAELAPFGVHVVHVAPGFVRTQLFRADSTVSSAAAASDSLYSGFPFAQAALAANDIATGPGSLGATEPLVFARRLARAALSSRPPATYLDGFMWRVFYYVGCFAPTWVTDMINRLRLGLYGLPS